jgi:NosR/NirI family nitrous oxide reductase transcriptional regulator
MPFMRKNLATSVDFYLVAFFLLLLSCIANPTHARAHDAYEAALPTELKTAKNMCALVACTEAFPGAKSFSERMGQPPYVEAYGEPIAGKKLAWLCHALDRHYRHSCLFWQTRRNTDGHGSQGTFRWYQSAQTLRTHSLLSIPESALLNFNKQYLGKSVTDKIEVGQSRPDEGVLGVDAISGATVTVIVQNQVMMTSGMAIARQTGIVAPTVREPAKYALNGRRLTWAELVKQGSVQRLLVKPEQVGLEKMLCLLSNFGLVI